MRRGEFVFWCGRRGEVRSGEEWCRYGEESFGLAGKEFPWTIKLKRCKW